jgi:hypothetical protein
MANTNRFARIPVGGDPLIPSKAIALAQTLLDGDRRLAIVYINTLNPKAAKLRQEDYLPAVVMEIKKQRGWDYDTYPIYISPPNCKDYERVQWSKDPFSEAPSFGEVNVAVKEEDLDRIVRSFLPRTPVPAQFHDKDLSQYHMLNPSIDPD